MLLGDYTTMSNHITPNTSEKLPQTIIYPDIKYSPPPMTFTDTQRELMQKFNIAFYEAQSRSPPQTVEHDNILETFDERYFTNIEKYEQNDSVDTNSFIDFLLPRSDSVNSTPTTNNEEENNFDYRDFCEKFEEQVNGGQDVDNSDSCIIEEIFRERKQSFSGETEVCGTETDQSVCAYSYTDASMFDEDVFVRIDNNAVGCTSQGVIPEKNGSSFHLSPTDMETRTLDTLELSDIDLSESISNASLDLDNLGEISYDYDSTCVVTTEDYIRLPPVNTINRGIDFTNMLRNIGSDNLYVVENQVGTNLLRNLLPIENKCFSLDQAPNIPKSKYPLFKKKSIWI